MINIFVGNLDFAVTEEQLRAAFCVYGAVETVTIVIDRDTGQSRGFAFTEMSNPEEAANAILSLDSALLNRCPSRVNEARTNLAVTRHSVQETIAVIEFSRDTPTERFIFPVRAEVEASCFGQASAGSSETHSGTPGID